MSSHSDAKVRLANNVVNTDVSSPNLDCIDVPTSIEVPQEVLQIAPNFTIPDPMSAPALKWGILGTGYIASMFAGQVPKYSTGNIVAVGSRSQERADRFAKRYGISQAYGSYEDLVNDSDVEAVYVATLHPHHHDLALMALRAGKPVLVEKSFTLNRQQAEEVFLEARSAGLFAMEAMWTRFLPNHLVAREVLASGALGDIVSIHADFGLRLDGVDRLEERAMGGGALLDLGVYPISFIQSILGDPEMVDSIGLVNANGVDEHEIVSLTYMGALAVASANMRAKSAGAAEVICREGRIEFREQFHTPGRINVFLDPDPDLLPGEVGESWTWDPHVPGGLQYEAAEVARCVNAGLTQSDTMPWSDTIAVMEVMDQVRQQLGVRYPGE